MQSINASTYNYNSFGFSLQTSSGDTINLSLYNERSAEFSQSTDGNERTTTLSLSNAYGYSFSYEGNGIDAKDKKEIDEAMKVIEPMMDEYLKSVEQANSNTAKLTNTAYDINALLPKSENFDTQNYANDSLLKSLDKILEKTQNKKEKMFQEAQKLFVTI
ncbi:MAG: hypothetical protein KA253_06650 [Campylobacteraceae bacterium]|nr:hypothetical protein [Campylobacteraceae bacterium]